VRVALLDLPEGEHPLSVVPTDPSGRIGAEAKAKLTVVETELTLAPAEGARVATPASPFIARTGFGERFECSIDDHPYLTCGAPGADGTSPLTVPALVDGEHTLRVRARRGPRYDGTPVVRRWTVDTTAPQTETPATPAPVIAAPKAKFDVRFSWRKGRFTTLSATTPVIVTVKGKRTTLAKLVGKRLKPGTKIVVSSGAERRVITIRRGKRPLVR
jgi:hypothetical protein